MRSFLSSLSAVLLLASSCAALTVGKPTQDEIPVQPCKVIYDSSKTPFSTTYLLSFTLAKDTSADFPGVTTYEGSEVTADLTFNTTKLQVIFANIDPKQTPASILIKNPKSDSYQVALDLSVVTESNFKTIEVKRYITFVADAKTDCTGPYRNENIKSVLAYKIMAK
jgi:hypothetical protein